MGIAFHSGTVVEWDNEEDTRRGNSGSGAIKKSFTREVVRQFNGRKIKKDATPYNPAYLIIQKDGGLVLKSHSEVRRPE